MYFRSLVVVLIAFSALTACSSKKPMVSLDEPEKFDKDLNTATTDRKEKVGVKENTVVIQKKLYLEEELSKLSTQITDLENSIYGRSKKDPGGVYESLMKCRKHLADPRIGGTGMAEPMEKWEKISETDEDFRYGVDDKNNVIAYSEEKLENRITNLKKSKRILDDKYDYFKEKLDVCENKYRTALINHGIKPEDREAKGEWVDGPSGQRVWRMRRTSTDDPEELMRRKEERERNAK